jgi:hypothetical protein
MVDAFLLQYSQGFSYKHQYQGCLAPAEFIDSSVWHPMDIMIKNKSNK